MTGISGGAGIYRITALADHDTFASDISLLRGAFRYIAVQQKDFFGAVPETPRKKPIWHGVLTGDGVSGLVPAF